MSPALTRRTLLGAGAALGATTLPAVSKTEIPASDCNAALFDLIHRHGEAVEAVVEASRVSDEAWRAALAAYPPRPDALRFQARDLGHELGSSGRERTAEGRWLAFYTAADVERLRTAPPLTRWDSVGDGVYPPPRKPDPEGEARRLEIVGAWDGWQADCRAVDDLTGYTAASAAEDAAADLVVTLACEVKRARPRTLAGLRALAGWHGRQAAEGAAHDDALAQLAAAVAAFGEVGA